MTRKVAAVEVLICFRSGLIARIQCARLDVKLFLGTVRGLSLGDRFYLWQEVMKY